MPSVEDIEANIAMDISGSSVVNQWELDDSRRGRLDSGNILDGGSTVTTAFFSVREFLRSYVLTSGRVRWSNPVGPSVLQAQLLTPDADLVNKSAANNLVKLGAYVRLQLYGNTIFRGVVRRVNIEPLGKISTGYRVVINASDIVADMARLYLLGFATPADPTITTWLQALWAEVNTALKDSEVSRHSLDSSGDILSDLAADDDITGPAVATTTAVLLDELRKASAVTGGTDIVAYPGHLGPAVDHLTGRVVLGLPDSTGPWSPDGETVTMPGMHPRSLRSGHDIDDIVTRVQATVETDTDITAEIDNPEEQFGQPADMGRMPFGVEAEGQAYLDNLMSSGPLGGNYTKYRTGVLLTEFDTEPEPHLLTWKPNLRVSTPDIYPTHDSIIEGQLMAVRHSWTHKHPYALEIVTVTPLLAGGLAAPTDPDDTPSITIPEGDTDADIDLDIPDGVDTGQFYTLCMFNRADNTFYPVSNNGYILGYLYPGLAALTTAPLHDTYLPTEMRNQARIYLYDGKIYTTRHIHDIAAGTTVAITRNGSGSPHGPGGEISVHDDVVYTQTANLAVHTDPTVTVRTYSLNGGTATNTWTYNFPDRVNGQHRYDSIYAFEADDTHVFWSARRENVAADGTTESLEGVILRAPHGGGSDIVEVGDSGYTVYGPEIQESMIKINNQLVGMRYSIGATTADTVSIRVVNITPPLTSRLSSVTFTPGTLSSTFDPNISEYTVTFEHDVAIVDIAAVAELASATYFEITFSWTSAIINSSSTSVNVAGQDGETITVRAAEPGDLGNARDYVFTIDIEADPDPDHGSTVNPSWGTIEVSIGQLQDSSSTSYTYDLILSSAVDACTITLTGTGSGFMWITGDVDSPVVNPNAMEISTTTALDDGDVFSLRTNAGNGNVRVVVQ